MATEGVGAGGGAASAGLSNRSTTSRLPYWALGAREKLFGVTAFFRSMTTRRSVGVRWAERMAVIGVFDVLTLSGAPRVAPLMSMTRRSGAVRVKTLCCTGPVRSNTSRVLSGARHRRTLLTFESATASTVTAKNNTPTAATNARKRIPNPIIYLDSNAKAAHQASPREPWDKIFSERPLSCGLMVMVRSGFGKKPAPLSGHSIRHRASSSK
ncbi:hypothetical protein D9M73_134390 [compost metagenome]